MYRKLVVLLALCAVALPSFGGKTVTVRPHLTKQGTYVKAHQRTAPNATQRDNWSSKPNVNPITGKPGTKRPKK